MPVTLLCDVCTTPFSVIPARATVARFCSRRCKGLAQRAATINAFWDNVQHCVHEWLCPYCCWPWLGSCEPISGYGVAYMNNRKIGAHRAAWILGNDQPLPPGLSAAHYCHNRPCCNFIHIHAATQKENIADSLRDNRVLRGEKHGMSKLTNDGIRQIFLLSKAGWADGAIAKHLHVSRTTVGDVLHRTKWLHVQIDSIS
jgi:hypothetical protein